MEGGAGPEELTSDAARRREPLLRRMREHAGEGRICAGCSGACCTFVANSIRITPLEALDLQRFLSGAGRWNESLLVSLRDVVRTFRLDQAPGDGRRSLRRTYTCPFFRGHEFGCTIAPSHKPYGCLAFNPRRLGPGERSDCASEQELLRAREKEHPSEAVVNARLVGEWGWPEPSLPIPVALLALPFSTGAQHPLPGGRSQREGAVPVATGG